MTVAARDQTEDGVDQQDAEDEDVADVVERAPAGQRALDGHGAEREDDIVEQQLRDDAEEALEDPVCARRLRDLVLVENKAREQLLLHRRHNQAEHGRVQEEQVVAGVHALCVCVCVCVCVWDGTHCACFQSRAAVCVCVRGAFVTNVQEGAEEECDDVGKEVRRRGLLHALKDVLFQVVLWRLLQQTQTQGEGVVLPREKEMGR